MVLSNDDIEVGDFIIDTEKYGISIQDKKQYIPVICKEILSDGNLIWESLDKKSSACDSILQFKKVLSYIEEVFVSYNTAILAKEKRFNYVECLGYYHINAGYSDGYGFCYSEIYKQKENTVLAPTQAILQKWLRDFFRIDIQITLVKAGYDEYKVEIYKRPKNSSQYTYFYLKEDNELIKVFHSYEKALEEGLQEALKLI